MRNILCYGLALVYIAVFFVIVMVWLYVNILLVVLNMTINLYGLNRIFGYTIILKPEDEKIEKALDGFRSSYIVTSIKLCKESLAPKRIALVGLGGRSEVYEIVGFVGIPAYVEILKGVEPYVEYETTTCMGYDFNITDMAIFAHSRMESPIDHRTTEEYRILRSSFTQFIHSKESKKLTNEQYIAELKTIYENAMNMVGVHR